MRYILFILFIIGFLIKAICQNNDRPTQRQIETQKQDAISKAKKTKEETIKKLADAKANNEDAEKIKQIESRLASLDQMITMLEKTNISGDKTPKELPPAKTKEPPYVSPFAPIKLSKPVATPSWEQAKDKLFWYSGRRIDANTLITPSGLVVQYDRQNNTITLQPPNSGPQPDTLYYGLINTLSQIKSVKNDYTIRMDNMINSFFMFPEIENAYNEFDLFRERFYELAKNIEEMPPNDPNINLYITITSLENLIYSPPPIQIILPPKRPNDLCMCNNRTKSTYMYIADKKVWLTKFFKEEYQMAELLAEVFVQIDNIRQSGSPLPSVASSIINNDGRVETFILNRMKTKLNELTKVYEQGNVLIEDGLTEAYLNVLNNLRKFDVKNTRDFYTIRSEILILSDKIQKLISSNIFESYIEKQKAEININKVFDYGLYLSHELNRKVVNPKSEINQILFLTWMEGLKKFNRFKLSIDLDFKYQISSETGEATMWATGFLKNDVDMYVGLGKRDCKWILFLTEVNHRNLTSSGEEFNIPMRIVNGEKDYINDKKPPFPYSGPRVMKMVFPTFKINFCGEGSEVLMNVLSFSSADAKSHENDDPKAGYTTDIIAFANKMLLGIKKTEVNVNQLINIAGDMMNMTSIGNSQMSQSSGNPALDRMKTEYEMNKQRMDLQDRLAQTSHKDKTVIPLTGYAPGSSLLFSPTYDMVDEADEDRKMGIMLTKAILKLKVEHAPR
jgi:hypothetical protein